MENNNTPVIPEGSKLINVIVYEPETIKKILSDLYQLSVQGVDNAKLYIRIIDTLIDGGYEQQALVVNNDGTPDEVSKTNNEEVSSESIKTDETSEPTINE